MLPIVRKYISSLFILTTIILIIIISISGCINDNDEITVDLYNTVDGVVQYPPDETDVIYFGFDLRLSPKEDAKIYAPFLQYISEETGRTFKIHFTPCYSSTVDELGEDVTQFAALGGLNYINAHDKYNATCLVRGLNEEGRSEYRAAIITQPDSDIYEIERRMLEDNNILMSDIGECTYKGSHMKAASGVVTGQCDAGGVQDTLAQSLASEGLVRIVAYSDYWHNPWQVRDW